MREVFHAAGARGQATLDASRQLASLAVFDSWEGATAEARKHTNASIRQDLDAHGNESLAVARAAGKAADDIDKVQGELRTLRGDAAAFDMTIDPLTNKVVPSSTFKGSSEMAVFVEGELQPRLDAILAEANTVDQELAAAINMAEGNTPIPTDPRQAPAPAESPAQGGQPPPQAAVPWDTPPAGQNAATGQWQLDRSRSYDGPSARPQGPNPGWQPIAIPQKIATGPSTGLLSTDRTGLSDTADGFDVQQAYKIRLTGGQFTGITKMVQGSDGKWYQARWMENTYEMQTTKVLQGTGDLGGITGYPITMKWTPASLGEIMKTSTMYPGKIFYLPDGCGGSIPIVDGKLPTPNVPVMSAPH